MRKQVVDRFTLVEALGGSGAQSSVYKATETLAPGVTRTVALKVLPVIAPHDKATEARFLAELRALIALGSHPHVVTLLGAGLTEGMPWIAMEYLPTNLASVASDKAVPPGLVVKMLRQVAEALDAIHSQDPPLLHNDLKPANILIDQFSNFKVTDFGSATLASLEGTRAMGTVHYAAPEVLSREFGKTCPATDLYALGHIAYEMALGGRNYRRQFPAVFEGVGTTKDANPARWMAWHCSLEAQAASITSIEKEFPRRLSEIIAKLMAKPLSERYASAKDLLNDLTAGSDVRPTAAAAPAGAAKGSSPPPVPLAGEREATTAVAAPEPAAAGHAAKPAKPAAVGGVQYYVRLRGRQNGPYDLPTLQRQARQGLISRLHQVSTDKTTWLPASSLEGLFS